MPSILTPETFSSLMPRRYHDISKPLTCCVKPHWSLEHILWHVTCSCPLGGEHTCLRDVAPHAYPTTPPNYFHSFYALSLGYTYRTFLIHQRHSLTILQTSICILSGFYAQQNLATKSLLLCTHILSSSVHYLIPPLAQCRPYLSQTWSS